MYDKCIHVYIKTNSRHNEGLCYSQSYHLALRYSCDFTLRAHGSISLSKMLFPVRLCTGTIKPLSLMNHGVAHFQLVFCPVVKIRVLISHCRQVLFYCLFLICFSSGSMHKTLVLLLTFVQAMCAIPVRLCLSTRNYFVR